MANITAEIAFLNKYKSTFIFCWHETSLGIGGHIEFSLETAPWNESRRERERGSSGAFIRHDFCSFQGFLRMVRIRSA